MNRKQSELEGRLDNLLTRIATETHEIKELEQQLTTGQILINERLQKDLRDVISGLQEYLRGLRLQAHGAQQKVLHLQAENQSLQLHLEDTQRHCRDLEDTAKTHAQKLCVQQGELSLLRREALALRDRQVEQEAELQQLREELSRQVTLAQLERDTLQAAADKDKQSRESQLKATIHTLQEDKLSLQQQLLRLRDWGVVPGTPNLNRVDLDLDQDQEKEQEQAATQTLRHNLQRSQNRTRCVRQTLGAQPERSHEQLQEVLQERDRRRRQSGGHDRSVTRLHRKLQQLRRVMGEMEALTAEQLTSISEQLRALNHSMELLYTQNFSSTKKRRQQKRPPTEGGNCVHMMPTYTDPGTHRHTHTKRSETEERIFCSRERH
ncbi:centriolin isoform X2 [Parambassis ranga]|uniref:Centriolin isoform X2 n=1 Tax=Parambassis ranga TaxID=210632 RepID=A0A6P7J038_9TELE|nr:centriolin-like isoform X2 [Parambassis ranga]